jgi:DNA-binding transcriptional MerR regulator
MLEDDLPPDLPRKLFFRIGEVGEIVGVEPHVLRYWEVEFRIRPRRSQSGQRLYQRKDIGRFLRIRRLLHDEGFTIAGARKALDGDAAAPSGERTDGNQVRAALNRVVALRDRVVSARGRFAKVLPFPLPDEDGR